VTRLLWSPRASADLDLIREYISRDSQVYADLVIRRLVLAPERLIQFPEIGRVVPEVGSPQLRELIVRPFRVVYRIRPGLAEIVTVFRSSRQFPADLE
jgi:plasmid stabilization system protein ParE